MLAALRPTNEAAGFIGAAATRLRGRQPAIALESWPRSGQAGLPEATATGVRCRTSSSPPSARHHPAPSRSEQSARAATVPLAEGLALILILLLSLGLWAMIWGPVALAVAALG